MLRNRERSRSVLMVKITLSGHRKNIPPIIRPVARSYQRKAGIFALFPCKMPAWLAPVWDDRSHSHPTIRCDPDRSQRDRVGMKPSRMARRSVGSESPSISKKSTPGTSVAAGCVRRCIVRCTPLR